MEINDGSHFAEMAEDGSLSDVGFDKECKSWISDWISGSIELVKNDNPNTEYLVYTIVLKETREVIGAVGCSYYDDLEQTGITYFIGAKYRNNGYAVEAARRYTEYFLSHYKSDALIATVREANTSSCTVAEKVGFKLIEKKFYKDTNDVKEELYNFYVFRKE